MSLPIGALIGKFKIISHLGSGKMGEVYLAHDNELGREVALKILPSDVAADKQRLSRFQREARAASALNHPNILTVHEIGYENDTHFIATELVEGETLRKRMTGAPMRIEEALDISVQVVKALSVAHEKGIVHRDIKPENIMIRGSDSLVKVLDFGLAKLIAREPSQPDATTKSMGTAPGTLLGTPLYMSPEQVRGDEPDARSDFWSLGVILYEMIAGRKPFTGDTIPDLMSSILHRNPDSLITQRPEVGENLEWIVMRSLDKDRSRRYQRALDLWIELNHSKELLARETPPRPTRPVREWTESHQDLVKILGACQAYEAPQQQWDPQEAGVRWLFDISDKTKWLQEALNKSTKETCLICYSLAAWKESLEREIKLFLGRGGALRVLMLNPESSGFSEKSAIEALAYMGDSRLEGPSADANESSQTDVQWDRWKEITEEVRRLHRKHIVDDGIGILKIWKRNYPQARVEYNLYNDTPMLYGFLFDNTRMYISSYFIDPVERGFNLPALCIDDLSSASAMIPIHRVFRHWFETKFITGSVI